MLDSAENIIRDEDGRVRFHYVIIDMIGRYVSGEAKAQSDTEECRWVDLKDIEKMDTTSNLCELLKRNMII